MKGFVISGGSSSAAVGRDAGNPLAGAHESMVFAEVNAVGTITSIGDSPVNQLSRFKVENDVVLLDVGLVP